MNYIDELNQLYEDYLIADNEQLIAQIGQKIKKISEIHIKDEFEKYCVEALLEDIRKKWYKIINN